MFPIISKLMSAVNAITPVDGRYRATTEPLSQYCSERALFRYRVLVETEYLLALARERGVGVPQLNATDQNTLRGLYERFSQKDAERIKELESQTNHDVKAVEYWLREKLKRRGSSDSLQRATAWLHFALTSEDVNNCAYALMLGGALREVLVPAMQEMVVHLSQQIQQHKGLAMLARTHGQPASPTTLGKEYAVFAGRLTRQLNALRQFTFTVKLNGATGNYNAHVAAYPRVHWPDFAVRFVAQLAKCTQVSLTLNPLTTQIEPHDTYAEFFDTVRRFNVIVIDLNQDMWRYVSDGWLVQKPVAGEVGSSTMPHKVNPIDFENSEGNLGVANALAEFFSRKLPVSRLQRDLSDSTVERVFGTALAHSLIAYRSTLKGLRKIYPNSKVITSELAEHPEVLAEAIQTILRREGVADAYEQLKAATRGRHMTIQDFHAFVGTLRLSPAVRAELLKLSPETYIGLAEKLAGQAGTPKSRSKIY